MVVATYISTAEGVITESTHGKERIETICCINWSLKYNDEITKSAHCITTTWITCCNFQLWNTGWHCHHQQLCEIVWLSPPDSGNGVKSWNLAICYKTAMSSCSIGYHGKMGKSPSLLVYLQSGQSQRFCWHVNSWLHRRSHIITRNWWPCQGLTIVSGNGRVTCHQL